MPRKKIVIGDYGINPFINSLVIECTEKVTSKGDSVDSEYLERKEYVKVFRDVLSREKTFDLTPIGKTMFLYIMHRLDPASDMIEITPKKFNEYMGIKSLTSYYNGVNDLHKKGIINPVCGHKYNFWVNPDILFVGSRVNKYPDKILIKSTIKKR